MFRLAVLAAAAVGFVMSGCAADRPSQVDPDTRAAIGYAANAHYPSSQPQRSDKYVAGAVNYPSMKELEIINFSPNALASATVWVNGAYVRRAGTIAPYGAVRLNYANLLQAGQPSNDFSMYQQPVTKVEMETPDGFFTVLGPAVKR
jgi:hypothetical protein